MYVETGAPFEAVFDSGFSGLVGTVAVKVIDNDGVTSIGPTTANITETTTSGIYIWNAPAAPVDEGQYSIVWSTDGTFTAEGGVGVDELVIVAAGSSVLPPIPDGDEPRTDGPCSAWTTSEDVLACCTLVDPDADVITAAITAASEMLYVAGGKRHAGTCTRTVRPCQTDNCGCGYQVLSRGHLVGWDGACWGGYYCGCAPVSSVKLAGYAKSILEVLIDGLVVDPTTYYLEDHRYLVRKAGSRWPSCQARDVEDDELGAFAVTYTYGRMPPLMAQNAAKELACEIVKACAGDEDCALPVGVTRVTRQGITFERSFLARDVQGIWRSGLAQVDLYLNTANPRGIPRRATFWSPSRHARYAGRRI
jgi:hypothetical protein